MPTAGSVQDEEGRADREENEGKNEGQVKRVGSEETLGRWNWGHGRQRGVVLGKR